MRNDGSNSDSSKMTNRIAILKLISDRGAMSRKDIAESLGLTPAAVTIICNELIDSGIMLEMGEMEESRRVGRRKVLVDINYNCKFVIAIAIETDYTYISICDLKGELASTRKIDTDKEKKPEAFLNMVANEVERLMNDVKPPQGKLLGIGVTITGEVDTEKGISLNADGIWNQPVPVTDIFKKRFNVDIVLENNVKAFAEAELLYGSGRKYGEIVMIKWGPGISGVFSSRRSLLDKRYTRFINLGHCIVQKNGLQCRCGKRGCLETVISTEAIDEVIRSYIHSDSLTFDEMKEKILGGDEEMWHILDDKIEVLALQIVNMLTMYSPDKIIVYGTVFEMPEFFDRFLKACGRLDKRIDGSIIEHTGLAGKIEYMGPLAVLINERL